MKVSLNDVIDGNFNFYLKDSYRNELFSRMKDKYKDWRIVARAMGIGARNLFGIRRGFEYYKGRKLRFMSSGSLIAIQKDLNLQRNEIEKNIIILKLGNGGNRDRITFPFEVNLNKESVFSIKRALGEYVVVRNHKIQFNKLPDYFTKRDAYLQFSIEQYLNDKLRLKLEELRRRGLKPTLKEFSDRYVFVYRNPGTNKMISRIIPKRVILDNEFMKEFGKWTGDRCGGPHKAGVANKNWGFVQDFKECLIKSLKQPENQVEFVLSCNSNVSKDRIEKIHKTFPICKVTTCKTQFGDFAFSATISNKLLKNFVFDVIEEHLFEILNNSESSVRFAFYAGLFEADGSVESHSIAWSFGFNLRNVNISKIMNMLLYVTKFMHLLEKDGFSPNLSRKIGNTKKSTTLKYDIRVCQNKIVRSKDLKLFETRIIPYINHKDKLNRFKEMMKISGNPTKGKGKTSVVPKPLPEVNIGLVGL